MPDSSQPHGLQPGSSIHGIFQARVLEWVVIAFSTICQQIWKIHQWPQDWERSAFIPIPKKDNAKECSNVCTIALISHASRIMLKILQARLQQYMKRQRNQRSNFQHLLDHSKSKGIQKKSLSASSNMLMALTVWITRNCGKFLKGWDYQSTLPVS